MPITQTCSASAPNDLIGGEEANKRYRLCVPWKLAIVRKVIYAVAFVAWSATRLDKISPNAESCKSHRLRRIFRRTSCSASLLKREILSIPIFSSVFEKSRPCAPFPPNQKTTVHFPFVATDWNWYIALIFTRKQKR